MNGIPSLTSYDEAIVDIVQIQFPEIRAVYRYGSAGGVYERPDSDIDVALLGVKPIPHATLNAIAVQLMNVFNRDVDVVDMRTIPVTLRVQIAAEGARLFTANIAESAEYDSRAFSDYARLNEERRGILDDVRQRGRIYG